MRRMAIGADRPALVTLREQLAMHALFVDLLDPDVTLAKRCKRLSVPVPGRWIGQEFMPDSLQLAYKDALAVVPSRLVPMPSSSDEEAAQARKRADATRVARYGTEYHWPRDV